MDQWLERIETFMGIPKREIGRIGQRRAKPGKRVTVAMIQSLGQYLDKQADEKFANSFGTIIVDECHHIPAKTFRTILAQLSSYYLYGLTATPFRKGSDGKIIFTCLGEIIAEIRPQDIEQYKQARVVIRETDFDIPFNPKTDQFESLTKVLIHDSGRNRMIVEDVTFEINEGRKAVVITERKQHIDALYQYLKQSCEVITLCGDDSERSRKDKFQLLNSGNYQVLITTGQFFGEGTDLQNASCLFLVFPFSFKGKLVQYIGRVQRSEVAPIIYDYHDKKIKYLSGLFLKRNIHYRNFDRQATLFDDKLISGMPKHTSNNLDKKIKISFEELDFRYGAIAFNYKWVAMNTELEFEIENNNVRPEFDVLKPYFANVLKVKRIVVDVYAEFENSLLVAQMATSDELERLDREIIESVKFRYLTEGILNKAHPSGVEDNLLDLETMLVDPSGTTLYSSEHDFVGDLLKNKKVKHYKHIRYLSSRHDSGTLKLRFVLNPFSFVFLIKGEEQCHLILETLDTEEATYVWHIDKDRELLWDKLRSVDNDLGIIRSEGRQFFLKTHPRKFSRIVHNYTDERKGFILWKDQLDERLI